VTTPFPKPSLDKFTHLGEMGYTQKTLQERLDKFYQDLTALNTIGEILYRALDQNMAREVLGVTETGSSTIPVPEGLITTGTPSSITALFGDGAWREVDTSDLDITKADVGLGNVDNTSDMNKPVSTAQAAANTAQDTATNAALNLKAPKDGAVLTNASATTPALNDNDTSIATTAFVATRPGTYVNAIAGQRFDVPCPGGIQPLRNTLSTRTDIFFDYLMIAQPKDAATFPGYAIIGDGWRQESW